MAKVSKYIKLDKDVLMEYVYNDGNIISDKYKIITDVRSKISSYVASDGSSTGNVLANQLFNVDLTGIKYAKVDPSYYSYLQVSDYGAGLPVRHDTLRFHLPINWTFGEYMGFYVRVYAYDKNNSYTVNLSNFFFDMTDMGQQKLMNYTTPPLLFQEKLWGKSISLEIPALGQVSGQLSNNSPKPNSLNYNLSDGIGLNSSSPIFIDFIFITGIQTINGVNSYSVGQKLTTSVPQVPEFETLGLKIEHSSNGDFFEIYGTYNDNIAEFAKFISDSRYLGNKYYVQYQITMYEQNVRGKTTTITLTDNFNESVEFRPIIKYSTTTAIIDVEMRLIDSVDDSYILRRASYGMLQDEVSKYSMSLSKINLADAMKPKIYNIKNNIDASLIGKTDSLGRPVGTRGRTGQGYKIGISTAKGYAPQPMDSIDPNAKMLSIETVKVPFPVFVEKMNIIGKSDNELISKELFYGNGKMQVLVYPFDNVMKFTIARGDSASPEYMDLTNAGEIKMVIKNDVSSIDFPLIQGTDLDLKMGQVAFNIPQSKFQSVKKIFLSGVNLFYITAMNGSSTTVVYTGLFQIFDTTSNVANLNKQAKDAEGANKPSIKKDPNLPKETAIVTKKLVSETQPVKKGG